MGEVEANEDHGGPPAPCCPLLQIPLRQMVYLVIKELANIAEDVIMVTSSLTKDMNAKSDVIYRANAIRALCKITDVRIRKQLC